MATAVNRADALLAEARRVLDDLASDGPAAGRHAHQSDSRAAGQPHSPNKWRQLKRIAQDQAAVDLHLLPPHTLRSSASCPLSCQAQHAASETLSTPLNGAKGRPQGTSSHQASSSSSSPSGGAAHSAPLGTTSPTAHGRCNGIQHGNATPHTNRLKALYRDLLPLPPALQATTTAPLPDFSSSFLTVLRSPTTPPPHSPPTTTPAADDSTHNTSHANPCPHTRPGSAPLPAPSRRTNAAQSCPSPAPTHPTTAPSAMANLRAFTDSWLQSPPSHTPSLQPPAQATVRLPLPLPTDPCHSATTTFTISSPGLSRVPPAPAPSPTWHPAPSLAQSLLLSTPSLLAHEDTTSLARLILARAAAQLQFNQPSEQAPGSAAPQLPSASDAVAVPALTAPSGNGTDAPPPPTAAPVVAAPSTGGTAGAASAARAEPAAGTSAGVTGEAVDRLHSGGGRERYSAQAGGVPAVGAVGQEAQLRPAPAAVVPPDACFGGQPDEDSGGRQTGASVDGRCSSTWGPVLAEGAGAEVGLLQMVEDRVVGLAVKRGRLRQWARAAVHGRVLEKQLVHHAARNRLARWLRGWQRVVVEGAAAVEVQSFLLERAKDAKRQQVADQFRRMWLQYCSMLRWRVWMKQQRWQAAQQDMELRRQQADALEERKLDAAADRFRSTLLLHRGLRGWCWHVVQQRAIVEQASMSAGNGHHRTARVEAFLSRLGSKGCTRGSPKAVVAAGSNAGTGASTAGRSETVPRSGPQTYTMVEVYPITSEQSTSAASCTFSSPAAARCLSAPDDVTPPAAPPPASGTRSADPSSIQQHSFTSTKPTSGLEVSCVAVAEPENLAEQLTQQEAAVPLALHLAQLLEEGLGPGGLDSGAAAAALQLLCSVMDRGGDWDEEELDGGAAVDNIASCSQQTSGSQQQAQVEDMDNSCGASSSSMHTDNAATLSTAGNGVEGHAAVGLSSCCGSRLDCCWPGLPTAGDASSFLQQQKRAQLAEGKTSERHRNESHDISAPDAVMGSSIIACVEPMNACCEQKLPDAAAASVDCWDSSRDLEEAEVDTTEPRRPAAAVEADRKPDHSHRQPSVRSGEIGSAAASSGSQAGHQAAATGHRQGSPEATGGTAAAGPTASAEEQGSWEAGDDRLDQQDVGSVELGQSANRVASQGAKMREQMRKRYADVQAKREAQQAAARAAKEQAEREQLAAERLRAAEAKKKVEKAAAAREKHQALNTKLQLLADLHYAKHLLTRWGLWRLRVAAAAARARCQAADACCRRHALRQSLGAWKDALWRRRHQSMVAQLQRIGTVARLLKMSKLAAYLAIWWRWSHAAAVGRRVAPRWALQRWQIAVHARRQSEQLAVRHWSRCCRKAVLRAWHVAADRQAADRLLQHLQAEHNASLVARCHALRQVLQGWHASVDAERQQRRQEQRRQQQWSKISGWLDEYRHQKGEGTPAGLVQPAGTGGGYSSSQVTMLLDAYRRGAQPGGMQTRSNTVRHD